MHPHSGGTQMSWRWEGVLVSLEESLVDKEERRKVWV